MASNQQRRETAKRNLDRQLARRAERAKRRKIIGVGVTVGVVVVAAGLVVVLAGQGGDGGAAERTGDPDPRGAASSPEVDIPSERVQPVPRPEPLPDPASCDYPRSEQSAEQVGLPDGEGVPAGGTVEVTLSSTAGDIPVTLDRSLAPCTVNSFVNLAEQGFYTDTACHRLGTQGLQMLQCGDPTGEGSGGPGYTVPDEMFEGLEYGRGMLAMANTGQPDTGGSQFFMVYGDAPLPPEYTVFGTISDEGLRVLDEVARAGHDGSFEPQPSGGKPNTEVRFTDVTVNA